MTLLSVKNIKLCYQTVRGETPAIEDVSFDVKQGEFVSIVGPSGCGKSTLLSCIAGLTEVTAGSIELNGKAVTGVSPNMGYMLQNDNLLPWRTIYKNVLLGLEIQKKLTEENMDYARQLLKKYDLWDFKDSYPAALSGGMRQRAALIRTLAVKPDILLLDEAFSALDSQTRLSVSRDVYHILRKENKTMVMVTHDIAEAVSVSDRVVILSSRPRTVKKEVNCVFSGNRDPLMVRKESRFQDYFDIIWKEMGG